MRLRLAVFVMAILSTTVACAQVDWKAAPLIVVGDEDDEVPGKAVIVTGSVKSSTTGEPVTGASISVDLFKFFDYTDQQGRFALELPPGDYKCTIRHVGMITLFVNLRVHSSGVSDFKLTEGITNLEEVVISARPMDSNVKETISGIAKLNVAEIRTLPTLMGEIDILRSIQTLPGVTSVGEGSSGFNVRGGRADQNLVLLDGAPLFNSSHALGFISGFNQDVINNFTLYKGNVPANFGGRASSVLEVTTRQGDFTKWKYQGGVGPISSRFLAEGPIKTDKTSLLISGRTSYADWILKRATNPDVNGSSLFFYDANLGLTHRFNPRSSLKLSAYSSRDYFKFSDQFAFAWENLLASAEWKSFTDRKASPSTLLSFGQYKSTLTDPNGTNASQLSNKLNYMQLKQLVNYVPNEKHTITAGLELMAYLPSPEERTQYNNSPISDKSVEKNKGLEGAIFINEEFNVSEQFSVSAGLRISSYAHIAPATIYSYAQDVPRTTASIIDSVISSGHKLLHTYAGLEPRVSARFNFSDQQSFKIGYNRMRQYIHLISNTTAPTPVDLWQVSTQYLPPQISDNLSFGYFLNIGDNVWETSAEVFYKSMSNLLEYKNFPQLYLNPHIETELLRAKGRAYGGELYIRKLRGVWKGWMSYTYSRTELNTATAFESERINRGQWYPANYNKPHSLNLVINRVGVHPNGGISFVFAYNTGRPFTAVETSYFSGSTSIPVYSDRNKYKIPDYFRFDFSFTIGNIVSKLDDSLVVSIYNVFGRQNAYSVFYRRPADFYIPRPYKLSVLGSALPSITYNFKF